MSTAAPPAGARRARIQFTPRGAILALVVAALLFYLIVPLRTFLAERDRLDQLERQTQILQERNTTLQRQVAELTDPAYVERVARECLGMVKKGEVAFAVVPREGPPRPADCAP